MAALPPSARQQLGRWLPHGMTTAQKVGVVASLLILAQLLFRGWAAFGGFFYVDDFKFLSMSRRPLTLDFLMTPHDNKLMPGGLLVAWLVAKAGAFAWPAAAVSLIVMQALASSAAWIMLRTLFGARWGALVPLALYLFAPMTLTAYMWWGAAINLVPMQIAMFLAIAAHAKYLSTGRLLYAGLTLLAIVGAMVFYQKSLLIYPVLALLTVCYFTDGPWWRRPDRAIRRWWRGWLLYATVLVVYLGYHVLKVPSPVSADGSVDYPGLLGAVVFKTFVTTSTGGPWRWSDEPTPAAQVDPPVLVIVVGALVIAAVVAYAALRRERTGGAWLILAVYLLADGLLLASGRGATAGLLAASEARYVSDAAPVLVLALALAYLPLRLDGARPSAPRKAPLLTVPVPRPALAATGLLVALGCAFSSIQYVGLWHDDFPARRFVDNVTAAERRTGDIDILDTEIPAPVLLPGLYPYTLPSRFFDGIPQIHARTRGTNLGILDENGLVRIPNPYDGVTTVPPAPGTCGTLYSTDPKQKKLNRPGGLVLDMTSRASSYGTWMTLGYLSTRDGEVTLTAGGSTITVPLLRGANTYFTRLTKDFDSVRFTGLTPDTTLCISSIKVGHLEASKFS